MGNVDTNNSTLGKGSEANLDFSEMPEFRMGLRIIIIYGLLINFFPLSTYYLPTAYETFIAKIQHHQR